MHRRIVVLIMGFMISLGVPAVTLSETAAITAASVPEPSTLFLLGFGLIAFRIFISHRLNKMKRLPAKTP